MTADEQHELSALLNRATGEWCYLSFAQKKRLRELLDKRKTDKQKKELTNDNKDNQATRSTGQSET